MKHKCITKTNFFLTLFITIEFMLFCTFVVREICNMVPSDVDQSVYLNQSYRLYKYILEANYKYAVSEILNMPNTGLPVLGTVMMFLLGQSRLSMLIPNFAGFAALQITGAKTINIIFRNECAGWGFIGILLLTHTAFGWAANIISFRADFLFACLFSIWCILLFESTRTENDKLYYISAVVAGFMLFVRFFAICFIVPMMLIEIFMFWHTYKKGKKTFFRLVKYACGVLIGGGWYFLINIINFFQYYIGAMTSDMKEIWQVSLSPIENLIYYPEYFFKYHMGEAISYVLVILSMACLIFLIKKKKSILNKQTKRACLLLLSGFVVPYAFLFISNKQPLVISIWNGLFIFAFFCIMGGVYRQYTNLSAKYLINIFSYGFLIVGSINYLSNVTGQFYGAYIKDSDIKNIWNLNNEIVSWSAVNHKDTTYIILDRWNDVISLDSLKLCSVESNGEWLNYEYAIDSMNNNFATHLFDDNELNAGLIKADVIVVVNDIYNDEPVFPTDYQFEQYHNVISGYAADNLELLGSFNFRDNELQVYVKRPILIDTEWSDWLGIQNAFSFCKEDGDTQLIIEGSYTEGLYPELKACAKDRNSSQILDVNIEICDGRYKICVEISELANQRHIVDLIFDSFYVPNELSNNADSRKLAVLYPDNCYIERNQEDD
jgi:hypothetical protein